MKYQLKRNFKLNRVDNKLVMCIIRRRQWAWIVFNFIFCGSSLSKWKCLKLFFNQAILQRSQIAHFSGIIWCLPEWNSRRSLRLAFLLFTRKSFHKSLVELNCYREAFKFSITSVNRFSPSLKMKTMKRISLSVFSCHSDVIFTWKVRYGQRGI